MRSRDTDIVIVAGLGGSGPDHWQRRWQAKLPNAHFVEQADWNNPRRDAWVLRILERIEICERPVVAVAHSLGALALVDAMVQEAPALAGAFLVAPPDPAAIEAIPAIDPDFARIPRQGLAFPALMVASRNDPYATFAESEALAARWGATLLDAGEAGHINVESGHGPWPEGLMAFAGFLNRL